MGGMERSVKHWPTERRLLFAGIVGRKRAQGIEMSIAVEEAITEAQDAEISLAHQRRTSRKRENRSGDVQGHCLQKLRRPSPLKISKANHELRYYANCNSLS
jgi:hypothetical protein